MRISTLIFLLGLAITTFGQYIDGPANIRNKPNGDKLFSVNNLVSIQIDGESQNDWSRIKLHCYVNPNQLIDKKTIKSNSVLLSSQGDSIGLTFLQFQLSENFNENYHKYNELGKIEIEIVGYTFKNNIRQKLSFNEIISNKTSYADSCSNSYVTYQEENGLYITLINKCNLYETSIMINDEYVGTFIKEIQEIKRISGAEGQNSKILLEIRTDYMSNNPNTKEFSVEADAIDIRGRLINAVTYGCCGAEDYHQLFNSFTFTRVMDFESKLYAISIPNSKIEGYIGFLTSGYETIEGKMVLGTLTFSDGVRIINKVNFVTHDKQKFDNILRFVPDMEFISLNQKDKVKNDLDEIELWTKNFSKTPKDLTGFQFLVHFIDDSNGKEYPHKLEFLNGFINGNSKTEFDITID